MNNLVYIGRIDNYFGLKGELKLNYESNHESEVLKTKQNLYIDDKPYTIKNVRKHQNKYLVLFEGFEDINLINDLIKKEVFIKREDINLSENDYLTSELFGLEIIDGNINLGKVEKILLSKKDIYIQNENYIIPLNEKYLEKVDVLNNKIYVKNSGELKL